MTRLSRAAASAAALAFMTPIATRAEVPAAIAQPDKAIVATVHAEGAQIYACERGDDGKLAWKFREPIASLFLEGKSVGRHYAGPNWEMRDGSAVSGKVAARAPGRTENDIPLLLLEAVEPRGKGLLADVTAIQRLSTRGGMAQGPCATAGAFLSVPYSAEYAFLKKGR